MLFSRTCEHAIRTILFVATHGEDQALRVQLIADDLRIPQATLAKVVQTLTRHGLLTSQKGPGGGVKLARPAKTMTVLEIVQLIDGTDLSRTCILGLPGCSEDGVHCPLHDQWGRLRERIMKMLVTPSVAQLADRLKDESHVLTRGTGSISEAITASLGARGGRP